MEQVIIELIQKMPTWFVMAGVVLYAGHKMCKNQLKYISKIVGKNLLRNTNELKKINETNIKQEEHLKNIDEKISKNAEDIKTIKEKVFGENNEK